MMTDEEFDRIMNKLDKLEKVSDTAADQRLALFLAIGQRIANAAPRGHTDELDSALITWETARKEWEV